MNGVPTARQREIYEAVVSLGSYRAAQEALGVTVGAIASGVTGYVRNTGAPHPNAGHRTARTLSARQVVAMLPERVSALEAVVSDTRDEVLLMRAVVDTLTARIDSFIGRQPVILEVRPSHRRVADGGPGGTREHRSVRRAVGA